MPEPKFQLRVELAPAAWALIEEARALKGQNRTAFVREAVVKEAERIIEEK